MKSAADPFEPAQYVQDFVEAVLTGAFITAVNLAVGTSLKLALMCGLAWPLVYFYAQRLKRYWRRRRQGVE